MSCRLRRQHHKESLQIQVFMTTFIFYYYRYAMNCRLRRQQHKETLEIQVNATLQHSFPSSIIITPEKSYRELFGEKTNYKKYHSKFLWNLIISCKLQILSFSLYVFEYIALLPSQRICSTNPLPINQFVQRASSNV